MLRNHKATAFNKWNGLVRGFVFWFVAMGFAGCDLGSEFASDSEHRVFSGSTMGTYYRVESICNSTLVEQDIVSLLNHLVNSFSTYESRSEISRFNREAVDKWVQVSTEFMEVTTIAREVFLLSDGALDPTLHAAVERFGFGSKVPTINPLHSSELIEKSGGDFERIEIDLEQNLLRKRHPTTLDYSAVAKGFAVDEIAALLDEAKCAGYLIDIGGEVRVHGTSNKRERWRIGIQSPNDPSQLVGYLELNNGAVATSGTYSNTREMAGVTVSHIFNPETAQPINHNTISVTVLSDTAATADAWATALLVNGLEIGVGRAKYLDLDALFIMKTDSGELDLHSVGRMESLLNEINN